MSSSSTTTTNVDSPNEPYNPPPQPSNVVDADFRTRVLLPGQQGRLIDDFASELAKHLQEREIFNHGGRVVSIDCKRVKLCTMQPIPFRSWLETKTGGKIVCQAWAGSGKDSKLTDVSMSEQTARAVLAAPAFLDGIREISRLYDIRIPVRRADRTIELTPYGYDRESRIYTIKNTDASFAEDMPLEDAKAVLDALISDFPFHPDDAKRSRSVLITMLLALFCDCMFDRHVIRPAFINDGNSPGCGKTLAAQMSALITFGRAPLTSPPTADNQDKLAELIATTAQSGAHVLILDNWRGKVESGALESFITAPTVSGRVLGTSQRFEVEKACLVIITVNHGIVGEDMQRRSLICRFHIPEARPEDHRFSRPLCEADILFARSKIAGALWSFVRNWRDASCKLGDVRHPSFDQWGRIIGGILEVAGYASPLTAPAELLNDRLRSMTDLVAAAASQMLGDELWLRPNELLDMAREAGCFSWFVAGEKPDEDKPDGRKELRKESSTLGLQCSYYRGDRIFTIKDGRRIRFKVVGDGHTRRYGFERMV